MNINKIIMKTAIKFTFTILSILLFFGCIEKNGYYTDEEESIISLICDITWASKPITHDDGTTYQGLYKFNRNGTYTKTTMTTDKNGNESKMEVNAVWSFGDPSFGILYFGGDHYWDIDELTKNKFSYYDRTGEFGDPFMYREYNELTPYKTVTD